MPGKELRGFRFWKGPAKNASEDDTSPKQDVPAKSKKTKGGAKPAKDDGSPEADKRAMEQRQRRRQQVHQAQKRHRDRRAEYVKSLEAEVARLQHVEAQGNNEKTMLAHKNEVLQERLKAQETEHLLSDLRFATATNTDEAMSTTSHASLDFRYDPQISHERLFLDYSDVEMKRLMQEPYGPKRSQGSLLSASSSPVRPGVKGDSWAALDFILALEFPCRMHIHHAAINPNANTPVACQIGQFHGHALTTTAAVCQSAHPPPGNGGLGANIQHRLSPSTRVNWQLPHSEIDKLVEYSEHLELDDEMMTPAQAYAAVRNSVTSHEMLREVLNTLIVPLSSVADCKGLGSVIPTELFWVQLDSAIQTLKLTTLHLNGGDNNVWV